LLREFSGEEFSSEKHVKANDDNAGNKMDFVCCENAFKKSHCELGKRVRSL
jgi:hypothetical protein